MPMNLTDQEIAQFPPVQELVAKWDAGHPPGSPITPGGDAIIPFPYEEGLAIVHAIQAKRPGYYWPESNMVLFNRTGWVLGLRADTPPHP
ncbi:MAG TPA: hypothetical protein VM241_07020 [Candidatus Thermoplasmatota archaeon]|nr:hypothetical protein [Candidatus Thermoplasmatota archaeon]